jgi:hypothetical protein
MLILYDGFPIEYDDIISYQIIFTSSFDLDLKSFEGVNFDGRLFSITCKLDFEYPVDTSIYGVFY